MMRCEHHRAGAQGGELQGLKRWVAAAILLAAIPCHAADHSEAERALMQGRVDDAIASLRSAGQLDGPGHLLMCRAYYAEAMADEAVGECEAALQTLGNQSDAQDWMGRAYGMKADGAGPIAGFQLARKVKAAFEAAVQLDHNSAAAANDLSEYYIGAPSVVGGGLEKADALAKYVEKTLPQPAHRIRALAAEKRKDYETAENEFRSAVGVAGRADAWADLGAYYFRRGEDDKAVSALVHCVAADPQKDASLVDAASILTDYKSEPARATQWLRTYLDSGSKSDAAPAFKAHVILGQLLLAGGDRAGAKIEFGKALAMAANYAPAKKAMQGL